MHMIKVLGGKQYMNKIKVFLGYTFIMLVTIESAEDIISSSKTKRQRSILTIFTNKNSYKYRHSKYFKQ